MRIAYFDCFAGASGDMILGALMDAGLELEQLRSEIGKLGLDHYRLDVARVTQKGIAGSKAIVRIDQDHHRHHQRRLRHIAEIIDSSDLEPAVKEKSLAVFRRLAEAEAGVHGISVEQVHFHEVGAMDAVIDVVGAVAGLNALGVEKIICSPLHLGTGTVECAHGTLPVPAPATAELVKGRPVYSTGVDGELLTPTGAAILTTLADSFGPMPAMRTQSVGYGAGTTEPEIVNLLRIFIGEAIAAVAAGGADTGITAGAGLEMEQVAVVSTNIDDMNPQIYDHVFEQVLALGALDVYTTPVQMKKNRVGTLLTVICAPGMVEAAARLLLRETTTIGMRWRLENRLKAKRTIKKIDTPYGPIRFKFARLGNEIINASPEYDDCKRAALDKGVSLKQVIDAAKTTLVKSSS